MPGMVPEDIYELTGTADPRLSPDGETVAFVVWRIDREEGEYRSAIWLAAADGSTPPRQFTSGERRDSSPRWSPDGSQLAFTSSRGEGKTSQLYVIPAEGGEARKLTDLKEDPSELAWSPDGSRIAFCARVRDEAYEEEDERKRRPRRFTRLNYKLDNVGWTGDRRQHVFLVPVDGSEAPRQLTGGDFEHASPAWSPDGKQLAFVSARSEFWDVELASDVYVVDVDGGAEPRQLTESDGSCEGLVWSPDGSQIAFAYTPGTLDWPHHGQIAVVSASGGGQRVLTESLDRTCAPYPPIREPIWGDDGRIMFGIEDGGNVHVYAVPADGSGAPEPVLEGERVVSGFDLRNGTLVYTQTTPTALAELHAGDRALTDVGRAFAEGRELAQPERFTAVSEDGTEVDAWIVRPPGLEEGKRYPTLLNIHGGPFSQYTTGFFDEFQVYAGAGYVVLYANPRGSSGYSEAWGRAIRGPSNGQGPGWGTVDYQDLMAVVDTALDRYDFIDPDRLGVLGGSYGGFMTTWIVGHTDRFKAAVSERAVNNLVSAYGSSDLFWAFAGQFGSYLYEDFDAWVERSPSRYADAITTPLLIIHSENDLRCAIEQGEHLFITLRLRKHEVEMVRFPAESHELTRSGSPPHRVERFQIILDWFDRYLKDGGG
jgi:dipeptidyl aminopeptidase/acylaminoacyl peptidase